MKNYKSNTAFLLSWIIFIYAFFTGAKADVLEVFSDLVLILTISMMLRSEQLTEILKNGFTGFKR